MTTQKSTRHLQIQLVFSILLHVPCFSKFPSPVSTEQSFRATLKSNPEVYVLFTNASSHRFVFELDNGKLLKKVVKQTFREIHGDEYLRPPFLHINCEIDYGNRNLQPVCRRYFDESFTSRLQIAKFKDSQLYDNFDGSDHRWPVSKHTLKLFFQENTFRKAPLGQRLGYYQRAALKNHKKMSLYYIDDPHVAWMEIHRRGTNRIPSFLIFYDHSPEHAATYHRLEAELEKVFQRVYVDNAFEVMGVIPGVFLFDITRCDDFKKCRQIRNFYNVMYGNTVFVAIMPKDTKILPLNVKMQYSGSAFQANDMLELFEDLYKAHKTNVPTDWLFWHQERLREIDLVYDPRIFHPIDVRLFDPRDFENCVIVYTANYCIHCHDMAEKFEYVARKLAHKYTFLHVKADAGLVPTRSIDGSLPAVWHGTETHDIITKRLKLPFDGFPSIYIFKNFGRAIKQAQATRNVWMENREKMIEYLQQY